MSVDELENVKCRDVMLAWRSYAELLLFAAKVQIRVMIYAVWALVLLCASGGGPLHLVIYAPSEDTKKQYQGLMK